MNLTKIPDAVVVDASILVSIASKESATFLTAENVLDNYTRNACEFIAPSVIVAEVMFALCQKHAAGILTEDEYEKAVESFLDLMQSIATPIDSTDLVKRGLRLQSFIG